MTKLFNTISATKAAFSDMREMLETTIRDEVQIEKPFIDIDCNAVYIAGDYYQGYKYFSDGRTSFNRTCSSKMDSMTDEEILEHLKRAQEERKEIQRVFDLMES